MFTKDPQAKKNYTLDWSGAAPGPRLTDGDTITTSTWTVPVGITEGDPSPATKTDTTTTIWLSGGTLGTVYKITNHVVTAQGIEDDWSFQVLIEDQ